MGLSKRQQEIKEMLVASIGNMESTEQPDYETWKGEAYYSTYIGSYMSLDPCGRYHHLLSPNGVTKNCKQYWESLDKVAELLGGWIEGGEGDPTDIYFCMFEEAYEKRTKRMLRKVGV